MAIIDPTRESIENLKQNISMDKPVTMLNLLRFNEQAAYPAGAEQCDRYCRGW